MSFHIVCIIIATLVLSFVPCWAAELDFASIEKLSEQEVGRILLPHIYDKLGIDITITPLPAKRAEQGATSGQYDGELMRIWDYGNQNPQMIRLPTPYYQLDTTPFITRHDIKVCRETLADSKLVVVRGVKHTDLITQGLPNVHRVNDTVTMMKMLIDGRADIALTNRMDGIHAINTLQTTEVHSCQPLAVHSLYHYLHPNNNDLADSLDRAIRGMRQSGELEHLTRLAEEEVLGTAYDRHDFTTTDCTGEKNRPDISAPSF